MPERTSFLKPVARCLHRVGHGRSSGAAKLPSTPVVSLAHHLAGLGADQPHLRLGDHRAGGILHRTIDRAGGGLREHGSRQTKE